MESFLDLLIQYRIVLKVSFYQKKGYQKKLPFLSDRFLILSISSFLGALSQIKSQ